MGVAVAVVLGGYRVAGLSWRTPLEQVRPLLWLLVSVAVFHGLVSGWAQAAVVVGTVVAMVLLAGVVTLTTRTSALVDVVVAAARPLRRLGADPERLETQAAPIP